MQIKFISVMVEDQDSALHFYTTVLGFEKMADIPMGQFRWLTVTSPDGIAGSSSCWSQWSFRRTRYQKALFEAGIPAAAFITQDIAAEVQRLKAHGVKFHGEPANMGLITAVVFEDTCGNLINLVQPAA